MEGLARELKAAVGADCGPNPEPLVVRPDTPLDVAEIVFEGADLDGEFVAKVIEDPLALTQQRCDLLSAGETHGSVTGGFSGPPEESHSRTGRPST